MHPFISGAMTVSDRHMYRLLARMADTEGIRLEPSALAGIPGVLNLLGTGEGRGYLVREKLAGFQGQFTHIAWDGRQHGARGRDGGVLPEGHGGGIAVRGHQTESGEKGPGACVDRRRGPFVRGGARVIRGRRFLPAAGKAGYANTHHREKKLCHFLQRNADGFVELERIGGNIHFWH